MTRSIALRQRGFNLIEVLVAIFITTFGLLGLAGLQARTLSSTHTANLRSIATQQMQDMAERMRTNSSGVKAGLYDNIGTTIPADPNCITSTNGCSDSQLRDYDQRYWNLANKTLLPSGKGTVTKVSGAQEWIITVMWDDARTGAIGTACGSDPQTDLMCFQTRVKP